MYPRHYRIFLVNTEGRVSLISYAWTDFNSIPKWPRPNNPLSVDRGEAALCKRQIPLCYIENQGSQKLGGLRILI